MLGETIFYNFRSYYGFFDFGRSVRSVCFPVPGSDTPDVMPSVLDSDPLDEDR